MKNKTKFLALELKKLASVQEKLNRLKNEFQGEVVHIVAPGPSLRNLDFEKLNESLKDKLVISIKQAYDIVPYISDFHLCNLYNYKPYIYPEKRPIILYSVPKSFQDNHLKAFKEKQILLDMWIPVLNQPFITREQSISFSRNFDLFFNLSRNTETVWGPGMVLELGIPLALHMGCSNIVTIGWDIGAGYKNDGTHEHFYQGKLDTRPQPGELDEAWASTEEMYDWLEDRGIDLSILSDINPADQRFKRLTLEDL